MKDVQQAVDGAVGAIRDFARQDLNRLLLVNQTYLYVDMREVASVPENTARSVINRVEDSILSKKE
jgi:hypothetical protein